MEASNNGKVVDDGFCPECHEKLARYEAYTITILGQRHHHWCGKKRLYRDEFLKDYMRTVDQPKGVIFLERHGPLILGS
jgi:hypothetical protein